MHRITSTCKWNENCHSFACQRADWPWGAGGCCWGEEEEEQDEEEDEERGQTEVEIKRQRGHVTRQSFPQTLKVARNIFIMLHLTQRNIDYCPFELMGVLSCVPQTLEKVTDLGIIIKEPLKADKQANTNEQCSGVLFFLPYLMSQMGRACSSRRALNY